MNEGMVSFILSKSVMLLYKRLAAYLTFNSYLISWNKSHWLSSRWSFVCCSALYTQILSNSSVCFSMQGIVGNLSSGKSALVHRYLTGTYVQEESPEGEWAAGRADYSVFVGASHQTRPPAARQTFFAPEFVWSHIVICALHLFI